MQLLGTLDGMEPVVRQIGEHRGSPGFPLGCMEVQDLGAGKDASAALDRIRQHSSAH